MKSSKLKKGIVIFMALVGVLIYAAYAIGLFRPFFDPKTGQVVREIVISAIALELGWAALLIWVIFKSLEWRGATSCCSPPQPCSSVIC